MVRDGPTGFRVRSEQGPNAVRATLLGSLRANQSADSLIVDLMAAATRIISLNLGSQSIELAEFHARPHDGLTLSGYPFREVFVDPMGEGMQRTQMVAALREMLDELQIKSGNVNYAI